MLVGYLKDNAASIAAKFIFDKQAPLDWYFIYFSSAAVIVSSSSCVRCL